MKLKLENISCIRNSRKVLDQISASFGGNRITAVTGHNGSGKSTLLRIIAGLWKPDSGKVFYDQTEIRELTVPELARLRAIVLQNPHIPDNMTVYDLLSLGRFARRSSKKVNDAAICRALADTACTELTHRRAGTLSGGELRRVFLALALVQEPRLLLLDELEANWDAEFRRNCPALLNHLRRERDLTIIMVTHDLDLALHCADDILGLQNGKVTLSTALNKPDTVEKLQKFTGENFDILTGQDGFLRAMPKFRV